jgi:hypothetical protein
VAVGWRALRLTCWHRPGEFVAAHLESVFYFAVRRNDGPNDRDIQVSRFQHLFSIVREVVAAEQVGGYIIMV